MGIDFDTKDYDNFSGNDLIRMLTPHHQVQLALELAVGLLVPSEPLPPDTVLHHAMFVHLMFYELLTQIEIECDMQRFKAMIFKACVVLIWPLRGGGGDFGGLMPAY